MIRRAIVHGVVLYPLCLFASVTTIVAQSPPRRGDTTIVRATAAVHPGSTPLVQVLTLGRGSGAPEYQFTNVLLFDARDGGVFVVDIEDPGMVGDFRSTVRQYDARGNFVRTFGRRGRGPGEFEGGVWDVKELADGRVLLTDRMGILVFSAAGVPLARWNARAPSSNAGSMLHLDPAGFVYSYGGRRGRPTPGEPRPPLQQFLYQFQLDGTLADSTREPPRAAALGSPGDALYATPFAPVFLTAWSPLGYFVTASKGTYAIDLRIPRSSAGGRRAGASWTPEDGVRSIRRAVEPVPIATQERDEWKTSVTVTGRRSNGGPQWQWTGPDIPSAKPPVRELWVDGDGRIWVRLSQPARLNSAVPLDRSSDVPSDGEDRDVLRRWVEPRTYDIFEPSGRYLGQVRLPDNLARPLRPGANIVARGDAIWAVVKDGDDVPGVVRFRFSWSR